MQLDMSPHEHWTVRLTGPDVRGARAEGLPELLKSRGMVPALSLQHRGTRRARRTPQGTALRPPADQQAAQSWFPGGPRAHSPAVTDWHRNMWKDGYQAECGGAVPELRASKVKRLAPPAAVSSRAAHYSRLRNLPDSQAQAPDLEILI